MMLYNQVIKKLHLIISIIFLIMILSGNIKFNIPKQSIDYYHSRIAISVEKIFNLNSHNSYNSYNSYDDTKINNFFDDSIDSNGNTIKIIPNIVTKNLHIFRCLLVLPIILIAHIFCLNINFIFSIFAGVLLLSMPKFFLWRSYKKNENYNLINITILIPYLILSNFIHGRIIFATIGLIFLHKALLLNHKNKLNLISFLLISFLGMQISSGASLLMLAILTLWFIFMLFSSKKPKFILTYVIFYLFITVFNIPFIIKNLDFYGGSKNISSIYNALNHGMGAIIYQNMLLLGATILLAFFLIFKILTLNYNKNIKFLFISYILIFTIGLFGDFTLSLVIPHTIIFLIYLLSNNMKINNFFNNKYIINSNNI